MPIQTRQAMRDAIAEEPSGRPGWAWLRPFRRLDEYERALDQLCALDRAEASTASTRQARERDRLTA